MNIWIAALAAVLVQPLVLLVRLAPDYFASPSPLYGIGFMLVAVVVVAAAAVLLLGIPTFLMLQRFHRVSWVSLSISGFLLGGLPAAFSWPKHLEGFSAGQNWHGTYINTYVNGIPTRYAWLTYAEGILFFSLHGLVGALVFYAVLRKQKRHEIN
ncbi:hypothetical protein EON83_29975 [bacterium]|nr:MAG: hypothetical protein EON83_29975 [bacterium]